MDSMKEQFEKEVSLLAMEYIRKTSRLDENSTPEDFAREYDSAFERIADELIRLDKQKK